MQMSTNTATEKQKTNAAPIPLFLLKLVDLLENSDYQQYVQWSDNGRSFTVLNQEGFSKIVLPKYFKHNKFTSFVRQLNLYGFRKITPLNHGLFQQEEQVEFKQPFFVRGKVNLLHLIKRKVSNANSKPAEEISAVLDEVTEIKDNQSEITRTLSGIKQENEDLWREVVSLRQKHAQQQKVVNHLIKFLVSIVQHHGMGRKRRLPIEWNDDNDSTPKVSKSAFNNSTSSANSTLQDSDQETEDGPLITELLSTSTSPPAAVEGGQYPCNDPPVLNNNSKNDAFDISQLVDVGDLNSSSMLMSDPSSQIPSTLTTKQSEIEPSVFLNIPITSTTDHNVSSPISGSHSKSVTTGAVATSSKALQRTNSVHDLNTSVNKIQKNLESIQERISDNNEQYHLDYDLIQDLFSGHAVLSPQINDKSFDVLPITIPLSNENNQLVQYTGIPESSSSLLSLQDNTEGEKETAFDDLTALLE